MTDNELPPGWARAALQDLASAEPRSITDGPFGSNLKTADYTSEGPRVIRLQNIGDLHFVDDRAHISQERFERLSGHSVLPDDLLIAGLGEQLPRACLAPPSIGPAIVKADCFRVRIHPELDPRFLCAVLNSPQVRSAASQRISGVGRPRLNLQKVREIALPVPPQAEQKRIVVAIEEQFSKLEAGSTALERVRRKIQRMQAAVLRAAVTGQLTNSVGPDWPEVALPEVATIASGQTPKDLRLASDGPIPFYKVGDMNTADGSVMTRARGYLDVAAAAQQGLHIRPAGTVVFPKRGGAIATNKKRVLAIPSAYDLNTMGLVPRRDILSEFLYLWLSTIDLRSLADGSNVPQINHGDLEPLRLRLPSLPEQSRVVAAAKEQLSGIAALSATVSTASRRVASLRASILSAAATGQLVDQDPQDEPATALLERIAGEKAARNGSKPIHRRLRTKGTK